MTPLYYHAAKRRFDKTQTAILRSYSENGTWSDTLVEISAEHDFSGGPYQDTVGFAVGSNQMILPFKE